MKLNHISVTTLMAMFFVVFVFCGCGAPAKEGQVPDTKNGPVQNLYDNSIAFKSLKDKLMEIELRSISVIGVDDMINNNADRERQVYQAILQELTSIAELKIVEADRQELEKFFEEKNVNPSRGLSTDASINLAVLLNVDAILYGTIESHQCDVNIKIYSSKDGGVIFSETIQNLKLPIDDKKGKLEIPPGLLEPESEKGG